MRHWYTTPTYREPFMESDLLSAKPDYSNVSCPETEKLCKNGLALSQSILMGTEEGYGGYRHSGNKDPSLCRRIEVVNLYDREIDYWC